MKKTLYSMLFLGAAIGFSACEEGERKYGDADGVDIIPDDMQDDEDMYIDEDTTYVAPATDTTM